MASEDGSGLPWLSLRRSVSSNSDGPASLHWGSARVHNRPAAARPRPSPQTPGPRRAVATATFRTVQRAPQVARYWTTRRDEKPHEYTASRSIAPESFRVVSSSYRPLTLEKPGTSRTPSGSHGVRPRGRTHVRGGGRHAPRSDLRKAVEQRPPRASADSCGEDDAPPTLTDGGAGITWLTDRVAALFTAPGGTYPSGNGGRQWVGSVLL